MLNILYTLIIFPIEQLIDICYVFAFRVLKSPGLSIIGLSIVVSTLVLPLYMMAEKQQQAEREKQKQMKRMKDNIKTVFKGDKRFMMLSTLYRLNNYHPLFALRNSFSLFIQIPFFIAAYHFLTHLEVLNGQSFKFIKDLGTPDGLLWGINLLPVLMTLINIVSGIVYTKGLPRNEKIQVYGVAGLFLILLYNSPAALVLYWTCNNIYNLFKNIFLRIKSAEKISNGLVLFFGGTLSFYLLFIHDGSLKKRLIIVLLIILTLLLPVWKRILSTIKRKIDIKNTALDSPERVFFLALTGFLLLIGLVIPSSLIASSVQEFSFLKPFSSPLPYLGIIILQTIGISFWLGCIFFFSGRMIRMLLVTVLTIAFALFMLNTFIFSGNYGFMTPDLHFSNFKDMPLKQIILNIGAMFLTCIIVLKLLLWKKKKVLLSLQCIMMVALLCFGVFNVAKINREFQIYNEFQNNLKDSSLFFKKAYTFSRTGKNVLVIVLDRALPGYTPYIFEEKPDLLKSFSGFTYYPNTISFGPNTIYGMPGIFGGYYYTPLEINKRTNELWWDKYYEAHQVLPRIMAESGFKVVVYDQDTMDNSLYKNYENIFAENNIGRYMNYYLNLNKDFNFINYYEILYNNLIRFSFLKVSPFAIHRWIYNYGNYCSTFNATKDSAYSYATMENYSSLYFLSDITEITDEKINYSTIMVNDLTHEPAFMEAPDYNPANNITNRGESLFANEDSYHVNMASYLLLAKWFIFLKENGVYNNTRIVIVSDHGVNSFSPFPDNIVLPNGKCLQSYNSLLIVKDFEADFDLKTDNSFMTIADVPQIATKGIAEKIKNPFTAKELFTEKEKGVIIGDGPWQKEKLLKFKYNIKSDDWMYVHTNIFDPANWSIIDVEKEDF